MTKLIRNGSPLFYDLLQEMGDTHDKKSHDYANNDNPYGNYHFAGQVASIFAHSPNDMGFAGRIAEKMYRIANLEKSGKTPNNESVEDTERDIAVITTLWMASRREARAKNLPTKVERPNYDGHGTACNIRRGMSCSCGMMPFADPRL